MISQRGARGIHQSADVYNSRMREGVHQRLRRALGDAVQQKYGVAVDDIVQERPPKSSLGDAAFPVAFDLARIAKMAPRKIAEILAPALESVQGVERVDVAGAGYLNVFVDRATYVEDFLAPEIPEAPATDDEPETHEKTIVEHTNINPNKAAHIGHLRNAALGDSFVRVLRYCGRDVEVQNYIDDTGVQVADVVVGFLHIEKKTFEEVRAIIDEGRFDYVCWDLYARVSGFYAEDRERLKLRENTLKAIEAGTAPEGPLGELIAETIVRYHLATMERIDVRYDLLPWESDILRLHFWERAYELLREKKAIRLATKGKNVGCWIMDLNNEGEEPSEQDEKVIVRSNGTVTYVGKDIAYQMWKLGLLDRQFQYEVFHRYPDGQTVWSTTASGASDAPSFGDGETVYNVIDVRQAYLQDIVQRGVALLASDRARDRSHHFSYEMVALTPATCRELGFTVSAEEAKKPYLEVSGRRGLGVKADDLLAALETKARAEVDKRNPELTGDEQRDIAKAIARGSLRYFMVKYTKNRVIAFDFDEALSFDGDSGPYLQYAAVRAAKILQKMNTSSVDITCPERLAESLEAFGAAEADEIWSVMYEAMELRAITGTVLRTEEPAHLARFALGLAQKFNGFYHRFKIVTESNEAKRAVLLLVVQLFHRQHKTVLALMGIPVPDRM